MATELEMNLQAFQRRLDELLRTNPGEFALVHSGVLSGTYATYEDAIAQGYERFKREPFLVRRVEPFKQHVALRCLA